MLKSNYTGTLYQYIVSVTTSFEYHWCLQDFTIAARLAYQQTCNFFWVKSLSETRPPDLTNCGRKVSQYCPVFLNKPNTFGGPMRRRFSAIRRTRWVGWASVTSVCGLILSTRCLEILDHKVSLLANLFIRWIVFIKNWHHWLLLKFCGVVVILLKGAD